MAEVCPSFGVLCSYVNGIIGTKTQIQLKKKKKTWNCWCVSLNKLFVKVGLDQLSLQKQILKKKVFLLVIVFAGVITRYEVFLSGPAELQNLSSPAAERRVFSSSGWWDPSVSLGEEQLSNRSAVSPPESSATVTGLTPFSTYKIRVVSVNVAGSVTSLWSTARTMEGGLC